MFLKKKKKRPILKIIVKHNMVTLIWNESYGLFELRIDYSLQKFMTET